MMLQAHDYMQKFKVDLTEFFKGKDKITIKELQDLLSHIPI